MAEEVEDPEGFGGEDRDGAGEESGDQRQKRHQRDGAVGVIGGGEILEGGNGNRMPCAYWSGVELNE